MEAKGGVKGCFRVNWNYNRFSSTFNRLDQTQSPSPTAEFPLQIEAFFVVVNLVSV